MSADDDDAVFEDAEEEVEADQSEVEKDADHDDLGNGEPGTSDSVCASEAASCSTSCGSKRRKRDEDEAGAEDTTDKGRDRDPNDDSSKEAEVEGAQSGTTTTVEGEQDIDVTPAAAVPEEARAETEEEDETMGLRRRKIRRRQDSSSSSSSSSSSASRASASRRSSSSSYFDMPDGESGDDNDGDETERRGRRRRRHREEEVEVERPAVLDKPRAKCRYRALTDLRKRETGSFRSRGAQFVDNRIGDIGLVSRLSLAFKLESHEGCVNSLHFNSSGSRLASGSDDLDVIVWDWQRRRKALSYNSGHSANIFQAKFLPFTGDTHIVSTSRDGQVRLAELSATGVCRSTKKLAQHRGPVNKAALIGESPHCFLTGGEDGVVFHVDVREPRPNKLLVQKDGENKATKVAIYSVDTHPTDGGKMFCTAGRDQYVRLYDRRYISATQNEAPPMKKFCPHHLIDSETKANVTCAVFNYDGSEVIGSYNDDDVYLFKTGHSDGADYRKRYQGHRNHMTVKGVNFYGQRSEYVVSGSDCGHIFIWDKESECIVNMMDADEKGATNVLEPHPSLPVLATSGLDDEVKIWLPTNNSALDWNEVEKAVMKNCRDRTRQRQSDPMFEFDTVNGQMIWALWRQIRRSNERRRRRRAAAASAGGRRTGNDMQEGAAADDTPENWSESDETSDENSGDDEDDDDGDNPPGGWQCQTS